MVLENVKEMWTETPRVSGGKKGRPVNKDRFISKMWVDPDPCVERGVVRNVAGLADLLVGSLEATL